MGASSSLGSLLRRTASSSGVGEVLYSSPEGSKSASEPEGSPALGPSSSPGCPCGILRLPVPLLPDIPFAGTPPVGCPFAEFLAIPTWKKWEHSSSGSLSHHHDKGTHVDPREIMARSEHSSVQGNEDMP